MLQRFCSLTHLNHKYRLSHWQHPLHAREMEERKVELEIDMNYVGL